MKTIGNELLEVYRGTIVRYNGDGTVQAAIDNKTIAQSKQEFKVSLPLSWSGPNGEIIAGFPPQGAPVLMSRGHGGEWYIVGYIAANNTFKSTNVFGVGGLDGDRMSEFRPDRILFQTKKTKIGYTRLYLDPKDGINAGTTNSYLKLDPLRDINSTKFKESLEFTSSSRSIKGSIKRDIKQNSLRNSSFSNLYSHEYDDSLYSVAMDPSNTPSFVTSGSSVRNLPLAENREIVYEFSNIDGANFTSDIEEANAYKNSTTPSQPNITSKRDSRADAFSLSLEYPNHLIEIIKGTGVDSLSNIIDLNRHTLPIGRTDELSLKKNSDNLDAFKKIRSLHRKSIGYHFELNARKDTANNDASPPPDANKAPGDTKYDMGRDKSRFSFDIDKEGQFKLNVPASSETGNIPLLTRYDNASVRLAAKDKSRNPNEMVRSEDGTDIFLEDFANASPIELEGDHLAPDYFKESTIKYGTAYHDIKKTCLQFQDTGRSSLINYMTNSRLNDLPYIDTIVSDKIKLSGSDANAGGRSGMMNFDGFISINVGANTIDRQSLWLDFAGGVVSNVGRDRKGRSYVGNYDGDILLQIGGSSIGSTTDSRFSNLNDAFRQGVFDMRVVQGASGQLTVVRIDDKGVIITTYGRLELESSQDMVFKTTGAIKMQAEEIILFHESDLRRRVLRSGNEI